MKNILAGLGLAVSLSACAQTTTVTLKDSQTIHNAEATRIWIVQEIQGQQRVVYCDTALLAGPTRQLCVRWPGP